MVETVRRFSVFAVVAAVLAVSSVRGASVDTPILFVGQVPVPGDFTTIASTFGNHQGSLESVSRGGDLFIRYTDGSLKNLTQAAGFGTTGQQGANAIAVRQPCVHWNGTKAIFSMVIGAPTKQYEVADYYWQIYEITGLGQNETPVITKVPNQPATFNNVSPIYGTDDRIIFTSDRPRNGEAQLYPQLDEYEEAPTVSGLWSLDPVSGDLFMINQNPSGNFTPIVDSFGRVIFIRWDHLQRDQQADSDNNEGGTYGTFNYSDETASAEYLFNNRTEVYPEPRVEPNGATLEPHTFNQFFPWQINEDGTDEETVNHVGRHELHDYFDVSFNDDPNLVYHSSATPRKNPNSIENFFQIQEDAANPGVYYGIDAPEFSTHAAGQIISLTGAPSVNADDMMLTYVTHRDTASYNDDNTPASPNHSGHYRNPLPLSGGVLIAAHTPETRADKNEGSTAAPTSRYDFRLKTMKNVSGVWVADQPLTAGIPVTVSWWSPDVAVSFTGNLWELDPVEVRARPKPARRTASLESPEAQIFTEENVDLSAFQTYLRQNNLAVIVSRNVTTRDYNDAQQPFNLNVPGTTVKTIGKPGKVYDVNFLQLFQADQLRGKGLMTAGGTPSPGRRVIAQEMHDPAAVNPTVPAGTAKGSVQIASDGSTAAFVPARRSMTWQLTDAAGTGIVRERYWLTFQPGEIRTCTSCHGINTKDQALNTTPQNKPEALRQLLQFFKAGGGAGGGGGGGGAGGSTIDSDGDGFPNEFETLYGSSPSDPASTPFGGAASGQAQMLTLTKVGVKLNFLKTGVDHVTLQGTLPVPAGFAPAGKEVSIFFGGVFGKFMLNDKGTSPKGDASFKMMVRKKKGVVAAQTSKFTANFNKGSYTTPLSDEKLDGSVDAKLQARTVDVIVLFNQTMYRTSQKVTYSAKKGKTGSAK